MKIQGPINRRLTDILRDHVDVYYWHGIPVARVPAYSPSAVAEHTVALVLAVNRKIHRAWNRARSILD